MHLVQYRIVSIVQITLCVLHVEPIFILTQIKQIAYLALQDVFNVHHIHNALLLVKAMHL